MPRYLNHKKTNRYTNEFKAKAVQLSLMAGVQVQAVAKTLDIHPFMLSRWHKEYREGRTVAFVDPSVEQVQLASKTSLNRIELYTESFTGSYGTPEETKVFEKYLKCADCAQRSGLGVNAGHLSLRNLARFLQIPNIREVSIGHAIVVESIEFGISNVINKYHKICGS